MMGELVLNKVKGRKNWRPLFHDSSIPWGTRKARATKNPL